MIIEKKLAYWIGESAFSSVEAAQHGALVSMFEGRFDTLDSGDLANAILEKKEALLGVLSMTPEVPKVRKPRKPRSDIGKPRSKGKTLAEVFTNENV